MDDSIAAVLLFQIEKDAYLYPRGEKQINVLLPEVVTIQLYSLTEILSVNEYKDATGRVRYCRRGLINEIGKQFR